MEFQPCASARHASLRAAAPGVYPKRNPSGAAPRAPEKNLIIFARVPHRRISIAYSSSPPTGTKLKKQEGRLRSHLPTISLSQQHFASSLGYGDTQWLPDANPTDTPNWLRGRFWLGIPRNQKARWQCRNIDQSPPPWTLHPHGHPQIPRRPPCTSHGRRTGNWDKIAIGTSQAFGRGHQHGKAWHGRIAPKVKSPLFLSEEHHVPCTKSTTQTHAQTQTQMQTQTTAEAHNQNHTQNWIRGSRSTWSTVSLNLGDRLLAPLTQWF